MRTLFNKVLVDIAKDDPRIWMILADIGYGEIEPFRDTFPERWYNCGVAEQNMTGVACGVAMEGNIAITYSIANFPTLRCLEQIRNDVCYHNANVKIVIIGGGLAYGPLGVSHQATEDIAIMRALPNMVVFCPCDFGEAEAGVHAMIAHDGPFYYRCGYKKEPDVHEEGIDFEIGKGIQVRDGTDATIFFTGTVGNQATLAAEALEKQGIHCRVVSLHTVKPIDREIIVKAAQETGGIVTVEEHQLAGGLGSAVAEVLCDEGVVPGKFLRIGLPDVYVSKVGTHEWLLDQYGLSAPRIAERLGEWLR
ncbi:MAG: transketolase [Lentisphaerae bacterium]|jgi:transketolase|nr:transketolase [Lentisphaerota bacterium]MBT4821153.1 transketolase [Lentisphaerota bacterium]MBT5612852.1 transketolase [Lentisphaerota bacterium]MBT7057447.1 transketolase [Lentisphaerota bacterium]MBT7844223.1 transketolase [Lentisphaerota bacterium]